MNTLERRFPTTVGCLALVLMGELPPARVSGRLAFKTASFSDCRKSSFFFLLPSANTNPIRFP
jgi:hypothetical protein